AWDCQIAEKLPFEPHDQPLAAVVTPTRIYEGQP
ncbi:MAG: 5-formyltetrahydrofolate cyclo-ligase, partial [Novosphingobium sp.]